jgi:uncharacterized membrane-anchored protein YhcB (DUF1043 family)
MEELKHVECKLDDLTVKIDCVKEQLDKHIIESVEIKEKVKRHEKKLENGWASRIDKAVNRMENAIALVEQRLLSKKQAWKDFAFGIGIASSLLGILYLIIQIGG